MISSIFRPYNSSSGQRSDRTAGDRLRHKQKVREAIRDNIADIIAEESIIGKDKNRIIKVPIRGVKEYRFVYGDNSPGVGQGGDGEPKPGDVIGEGKDGKGNQQAGDKPGVDYYETDVTLDELIDLMFEDLELPDLERKRLRQIEVERLFKQKGFRRKGIRARLDKKRTARSRIKRKKATLKRTPCCPRGAFRFTKTICATITRLAISVTNPTPSCFASWILPAPWIG
jgi:uncharacterized protein